MAYNLSMQLNLQAPSAGNIAAIKKSIESGLKDIKVKGLDTKDFAKANKQIQQTTNNLQEGQKEAKTFFERVSGKGTSFAAYTVASTAILKLTGAISNATREAIKYEAELIKIAQVRNRSVKSIVDESAALVKISKNYNVTLTKVAQLTRTLTQTGLSFKEAAKGAEILARTSLLATFDSLSNTTEGLIAVMNTFSVSVRRAGTVLEQINAVSKEFAVESSDIVDAIRRAGGAFDAAGGQIEQFIALFTAVRSTTRESAETIATGFRTIFGRLQRPKTIEFFKKLGIELETAEGKFVGPYKAIELIRDGLRRLNIEVGSTKFAEIVEQIGGIRQISRVVPLLLQFEKAQKAVGVANNSSTQSIKDIEKAQKGLGFRLGALQKDFQSFIQEIVQSSSFKFTVNVLLDLAKALLSVGRALKPLLPLFTAFATVKLTKGIGSILSGKTKLPKLPGFARGGIVPGSGNGDTVPAMLSPGEFVVRKSAVQAFGAANLGKINRYADGGKIIYDKPEREGIAEDKLNSGMAKSVNSLAKDMNPKAKQVRGTIKNISGYDTVVGVLFEAALSRASGGEFTDENDPKKPFDFPDGLKNDFYDLVGTGRVKPVDAKKTKPTDTEIKSKIARFLSEDGRRLKSGDRNFGVAIMQKGNDPPSSTWSLDELGILEQNAGGSISGVGTDTVPALLTPGEFVVNKKSAQAYGYGNLKKINKYANGGIVDQVGFDVNMGRGTGDVVNTMDQFAKEMQNVLKDLGGVGLQIDKTYKLAEEANNKIRGAHSGDAGELRVNLGKGTTSTVAHETGHAVDKIAGGGGKQYASEQAGTLQNKLVEAIKPQLAAALKEKGVAEAQLQYRLKNKEIFADLFQQSSPAIRNIIANTTDYEKGMAEIADLTKKQANAQRTVTAKTVKGDAMSGGQGALTEQIKKQSQVLQKLTAKQSAAEQKWQSVGDALGKLDGQIKQGITNRKAQQKAANIRLSLSKQMAAAEKAYTDITKQVTAVEKQRADNIKRAGEMKSQRLSGLKSAGAAPPSEPPKFEEFKSGLNSAVSGLKKFAAGVASNADAIFIASTTIANYAESFLGANVNRTALDRTRDRSIATRTRGEVVEGVSRNFGQNLLSAGNKLKRTGTTGSAAGDKALNKLLGKFPVLGKDIGSFGKNLAIGGKAVVKFGKGFNVASRVIAALDIAAGTIESLFTTDYEKQASQLVEMGDAAGYAAIGAEAIARAENGRIPILGSIFNISREFGQALGLSTKATYEDLNAKGKLIYDTNLLAAKTNGLDKTLSRTQTKFENLSAIGDTEGAKAAFNEGISAIMDVKTGGQELLQKEGGVDAGAAAISALSKGVQGAAIGASIGTMILPGIGTAIGGVVGGVAGAAYGLYDELTTSNAAIRSAYEQGAESIVAANERLMGAVQQIGGALKSEAAAVAQQGGSWEDVVAKVSKQFGDGFDAAMGNITDPAAAQREAERMQKAADQAKKDAQAAKNELDDSWFDMFGSAENAKVKAEAAQKAAESEAQLAAERAKALAEAKALFIAEQKLQKERAITVRAIEAEIKLRRKWKSYQKQVDGFFQSLDLMGEELDAIGTGKLTTSQIFGGDSAISARTVGMSAEQVLQDEEARKEIGTSLSGAGIEFNRVLEDADDRVKKIQGIDVKKLNIAAAEEESKGSENLSEAGALKNQMIAQMGGGSVDPTMDAALLKYAQGLIDKSKGAGQAEEEALAEARKQALELTEQQLENIRKYGEKLKELRERELQLTQKRVDLGQKLFEAEMDFYSEIADLRSGTAEFLSAGKGKGAGFKARQQGIDIRQQGINKASELNRGQLNAVAGVGLSGKQGGQDDISSNVDKLVNGIKGASDAAQKMIPAAKGYLNNVRAQIDLEKDKLSLLKDQASAQREYTQALRDAQGDLINEFAFGDDASRANLLESASLTQYASQTGNMRGFSAEQRGQVSSFLDRFTGIGGDIGKQAKETKGRLAAQELADLGLIQTQEQFDQAAAAASKAEAPIDERMADQIKEQTKRTIALIAEEKKLKDAIIDTEAAAIDIFAASVDKFAASMEKDKPAGLGETKEEAKRREDNVQKEAIKQQAVDASENIKSGNENIQELEKEIKSLDAQKKIQEDRKSKFVDIFKEDGHSDASRRQTMNKIREANNAIENIEAQKKQKQQEIEETKNTIFQAEQSKTEAEQKLSELDSESEKGAEAPSTPVEKMQQVVDLEKAKAVSKTSPTVSPPTGGSIPPSQVSQDDVGFFGSLPSELAVDPFSSTGGATKPSAAQAIQDIRDRQNASSAAQAAGVDQKATPEKPKSPYLEISADDDFTTSRRKQTFNKLQAQLPNVRDPRRKRQMMESIERRKNVLSESEVNNNQSPAQAGSTSTPPTTDPNGISKGGAPEQEPIQIVTKGTQQITVNLPDIQALVNQQITSLIYETVAQTFQGVSETVRTANNFEEVASALAGGVSATQNKNMEGAT